MGMFRVADDIVFKDRKHAGIELAKHLEPGYKHLNPLVLGIPRGGVEVAYYVAQQLDAELSLAVAKKLPFPGHEEYGFGAVAEGFSMYVSEHGQQALEPKVVKLIIEEQLNEVDRRIHKYRQGKPLPDMKGRTVMLVDDGIATGVTLVPVVKLCQKRKAARIIIAAPVSGKNFDKNLLEADKIEILVQPQPFYSVSQVYQTFTEVTDQQLVEIMRKN